MFCPKCGKEIPDDSSFCYSCGSKIEIKETKNTITDTSTSSGIKNNHTDSNKEQKRKKNIGYGLVFLLLLYSFVSKIWIQDKSCHISNLTIIIIILCIPLLIILYFLLKKYLIKVEFFTNKLKLSSFVSGFLSIIVVFSIGEYFHHIDKLNCQIEECIKICDKMNVGSQKDLSCKSHYNKKLNNCFYIRECYDIDMSHRVKYFQQNKYPKGGGMFSDSRDFPLCKVYGKKCKSESEWDLLVKPYMEE